MRMHPALWFGLKCFVILVSFFVGLQILWFLAWVFFGANSEGGPGSAQIIVAISWVLAWVAAFFHLVHENW